MMNKKKLTVIQGCSTTVVEFEGTPLLADLLLQNGYSVQHPCGGHGLCGKCKTELTGYFTDINGNPLPDGQYCSCQICLSDNTTVALPDPTEMEQIETTEDIHTSKLLPMGKKFGCAVDLGTTTLVMQLYDLRNGMLIAETAMHNPQTSIAADVMGRIHAALNGNLPLLQRQIQSALRQMLNTVCLHGNCPQDDVDIMVITGNTTMLYLFTGRNPESLARAPFCADCLFDSFDWFDGIKTYFPPCMDAFVGADISCAVLASAQCDTDAPSLLCDIGTNGEIALWKNDTLYVTSTAAGPAFEGAGISCGCSSMRGAIDRVSINDTIQADTIGNSKAVGICGSGLIDAVASYLTLEKIDETGAIDADSLPLRDELVLLQSDIRAVQLAKAAISAGIQTVLETADISPHEIEKFYIAGGFGSHLSVKNAVRIGLIQSDFLDKSLVIGNAALAGAVQLLLNRDNVNRIRGIVSKSNHIRLSGNPEFNENYISNMFFPENEYLN